MARAPGRGTLSAIAAGLFVLAPGAAARADDVRVIVTFHGHAEQAVFARHGGRAMRTLDADGAVAGWVPASRLGALRRERGIASVEEDAIVRATNHTTERISWGVARIDAQEAWPAARGLGVKVGILDTGIQSSHPDFRDASGASRVTLGPTYVDGTSSSQDDNGHGTHVAGVAGASDNSIGVVGVAPLCRLVAVKVLDRYRSGWTSDFTAGIDWATKNGCRVINLSLRTLSDVSSMHAAVDRAVAAGIVVCAAAGNDGDDGSPTAYPAAYSSVIAVAATTSEDRVAAYSTRGSWLDIAAPGSSIRSTWKGSTYVTASGTSFATPHVSGTAALLLSAGIVDANLDGRVNDEVRARLLSTADDINRSTKPGPDSDLGNGLLDAEEAVTGIDSR